MDFPRGRAALRAAKRYAQRDRFMDSTSPPRGDKRRGEEAAHTRLEEMDGKRQIKGEKSRETEKAGGERWKRIDEHEEVEKREE